MVMDFEKMAHEAYGGDFPSAAVAVRLMEPAFAAGREAMRDEALSILKKEEDRSRSVAADHAQYVGPTDMIWEARASCAFEMGEAIRALPGKEGE